jgi:hypothetical protein
LLCEKFEKKEIGRKNKKRLLGQEDMPKIK